MQISLECKQCGGVLAPEEGQKIVYCKFCGSANVISIADRAGLYNRANYLRRENEFDRALAVYEDIIKEDPTDAEGYYGMALCKYGIEYVDDPGSSRKIPTCHRTRFTLISEDADFKKALECADSDTQKVYLDEAEKIDTILKKIQSLSSGQQKYDIFICYKEGDGEGGRTNTSVLAQDVYEKLTEKGYKVFFARKTLENKMGSDYEPIIFSALYSAKIMLVIGITPEEFQAIWVRNEWVRFLERISNGDDCTLIPLYKDMSPYELPNEMANIQAVDMSKIGFMQDLLDGIGKLVKTEKPTQTIVHAVPEMNIAGLRKRAYLFLEQGEFDSAKSYFERVLDQNPEDSTSYWGKLLVSMGCHNEAELEDVMKPIKDLQDYQFALRFADEEQAAKYRRYSDLIDTKLYEAEEKRKEQERIAEEERKEQERKAVEQRAAEKEEQRKKREKARKKGIRAGIIGGIAVAFVIFFVFWGQIAAASNIYTFLNGIGDYRDAKKVFNSWDYLDHKRTERFGYDALSSLIYDAQRNELLFPEPDFTSKILNWSVNDELDKDWDSWVSDEYGFNITIRDGEVVYEYTRKYDGDYEASVEDYYNAKELHKLQNDGDKIANIYSNTWGFLFVLYKDGKVKSVPRWFDYNWRFDNHVPFEDVEKWRNVKELKNDGNKLFGLTDDGDVLFLHSYEIGSPQDYNWDEYNWNEEYPDWDSIPNLLRSLY